MAKQTVKWQGLLPNPSKFFGFIYRIKHLASGKSYIGKKQYWRMNPKRKRKKPITDVSGAWNPDHWLMSDWEVYTGSSKELNAQIAKEGQDAFDFCIISQHACLGDLTYAEVEALVKLDTLTLKDTDGERVYYNGNIAAIRFIPPNKESEKLL